MGMNVAGYLYYGVSLGLEYKVEAKLGGYDHLDVYSDEYMELADKFDSEEGFVTEVIEDRLLKAIGYETPSEYVEGEYGRRLAAFKRYYGYVVDVAQCGCEGCDKKIVLYTKRWTSDWGDVVPINDLSEYDRFWQGVAINKALEALGYDSLEFEPGFILSSYYG